MELGATLMALLVFVVVKGTVIGFSVWFVWRLRGSLREPPPRRPWLLVSRQSLPDVRLLWWGLALFLVSELTCGVEIYVIMHSSRVLSAIHSVTSAAGMGVFALGLFRFLDQKSLHFGSSECALGRICHGCTVGRPAGCKLSRVLALAAAWVGLAALAPLVSPTAEMVAQPQDYELPLPALNHWYDATLTPWLVAHVPGYLPDHAPYVITSEMLVMELRIIPAVALAIGAVAVGYALRRSVVRAARLATFGAGVVIYSCFELVVYRGTGNTLVGSLGHELAELWFLLITAELLRRSFPSGRAQEASSRLAPDPGT